MARTATLKPVFLKSHGSWAVNVPPSLSNTKKRRQLFFATPGEARTECEKLKTQKYNNKLAPNMPPARISEASEAYKLLEPLNASLLDAVRDYVARHKPRTESISFLDL